MGIAISKWITTKYSKAGFTSQKGACVYLVEHSKNSSFWSAETLSSFTKFENARDIGCNERQGEG